MAGARAAVGRRKARALRSARAASDDAANSFAPFGALPPLIFLEANTSCRSLPMLGCGCIARTSELVCSPARRIVSDMPKRRTKSSDRPHTPKRLTPEQESAHRKAAFAAIRALFCQATQPWHSCQRGYCRRHHCCIAEAGPGACLGRHWPLMTPGEQKAAHIEVINGGPRGRRPQTSTEWSLRRFPPSNFVHG